MKKLLVFLAKMKKKTAAAEFITLNIRKRYHTRGNKKKLLLISMIHAGVSAGKKVIFPVRVRRKKKFFFFTLQLLVLKTFNYVNSFCRVFSPHRDKSVRSFFRRRSRAFQSRFSRSDKSFIAVASSSAYLNLGLNLFFLSL